MHIYSSVSAGGVLYTYISHIRQSCDFAHIFLTYGSGGICAYISHMRQWWDLCIYFSHTAVVGFVHIFLTCGSGGICAYISHLQQWCAGYAHIFLINTGNGMQWYVSGVKHYCMGMIILTMNLMLQSYWLCMSLLKILKDSDCAYYKFILHNYFVLTIPSVWNLLCMRVSTTWQLWLLDCIHLSQNVWCYTGDTCVSVLCECVYDWLSMLVQLYICCMGEGFNIASVLCPIPFHVNEINYV